MKKEISFGVPEQSIEKYEDLVIQLAHLAVIKNSAAEICATSSGMGELEEKAEAIERLCDEAKALLFDMQAALMGKIRAK